MRAQAASHGLRAERDSLPRQRAGGLGGATQHPRLNDDESPDCYKPAAGLAEVEVALAFSAGGAAVGWIFIWKSFIWALLLGYLPLRLLDPGAGFELILAAWMGVVAESVACGGSSANVFSNRRAPKPAGVPSGRPVATSRRETTISLDIQSTHC